MTGASSSTDTTTRDERDNKGDRMKGDGDVGERDGGEVEITSDAEDEERGTDKVKIATNPSSPTQQEIDQHRITHIPYRNWCPHCIRGKAREDAHRKVDRSRDEVPTISIDYAFMSGKRRKDLDDVEADREAGGTILVIHDAVTKTIFAHAVQQKGAGDGDVLEKVVGNIESLGYGKINLRCDAEPSAIDIINGVKAMRMHTTILEVTPKQSSASNGAVERAIGELMGQIRTMKSCLEDDLKMKIDANENIMKWLVSHAAMTISRYQVGKDGRTAYERLKGRQCTKQITKFAEQVLYKVTKRKGEHDEKCEARWEYATWLGIYPKTNEHIVCHRDGVIKCRCIRRLRDDLKWNGNIVKGINATPWEWKISCDEKRGGEADRANGDGPTTVPIEARIPKGTMKRMYIRKSDVTRYGETKACAGCRAVLTGKRGVPHTEACRLRIEERIREHEPSRAEKDQERSSKQIAEEIENAVKVTVDGDAQDIHQCIDARDIQHGGDKSKMVMLLKHIRSAKPSMVILQAIEEHKQWSNEIKGEQINNGGVYVEFYKGEKVMDKLNGELQIDGKDMKYVHTNRHNHVNRSGTAINVKTNSHAVVDTLRHSGNGANRKVGTYNIQNEKQGEQVVNISKSMGRDLTTATIRHVNYTRNRILDIDGVEINSDEDDKHDEQVTMDADGHWWRLANASEWVAYDDVAGTELCAEKVRQARREELECFRQMNVYDAVKREVAQQRNKNIIDVRWIDINKGDNDNPNYRSRLVGKEFRQSVQPELFAATPPIESMKILLHIAASTHGNKLTNSIMVNDIRRAYFYAPALREVYIELPEEDERKAKGYIGVLRKSLYGTRDAARNWQVTYSDHLKKIGFSQCSFSPCVFYHSVRKLYCMVHGDDYLSVGAETDLHWMKMELERIFEVKTEIIGPMPHQTKELKVLNRIIRYGKKSIQYELDPRHAELIISEMGLSTANPVSTPGQDGDEDEEEERNESTDTAYRAIAARANYLAIDRPDIQYATKEICRAMSAPTSKDWDKLKRLARYLIGKPRLVQQFEYQPEQFEAVVHTDANWAGCRRTRRSTSAGCITIGRHCLKTWSKTQSTIATSSAESELYAATRGTQEGMGVAAIAKELGREITFRLLCDASAAIAIIQRRGIGKMKHVSTQWLWIQQVANREAMNIDKVGTKLNPSDAMTKHITKIDMERHMATLGYEFCDGRASSAVKVATDVATK